jgi:hypothetical protein
LRHADFIAHEDGIQIALDRALRAPLLLNLVRETVENELSRGDLVLNQGQNRPRTTQRAQQRVDRRRELTELRVNHALKRSTA